MLPNTESSVHLQDEFNWHCSQMAQWMGALLSSMSPCGIQDTRTHAVLAPGVEGEREAKPVVCISSRHLIRGPAGLALWPGYEGPRAVSHPCPPVRATWAVFHLYSPHQSLGLCPTCGTGESYLPLPPPAPC